MANPNQGPSFRTDVHRAPTKKWVDAKAYSYEGDDWGGYDEYDDIAEPVPSLPVGPSTSSTRNRSRSFERGDEQRGFSAATPVPPMPNESSSNEQYSRRGESLNDQYGSRQQYGSADNQNIQAQNLSVSQPQNNYVSGPTGSLPVSALRPQEPRREFSQPYAVPQPLHTRAPSAPSVDENDLRTARFPPRKSSLSGQDRPANLPPISQASRPQDVLEHEGSESQINSAQQDPPRTAFIRPADIYRRMEEEREKARISSEAGRPSMDSIDQTRTDKSISQASGSRNSSTDRITRSHRAIPDVSGPRDQSNDRSTAPIASPSAARDVSVDRVSRTDNDFELSEPRNQSISPTRLMPVRYEPHTSAAAEGSGTTRPSLQTVPQQESVYGIPGFSVSNPVLARAIGAGTIGAGITQTAPSLPQVDRWSGFGADLWNPSEADSMESRTGMQHVQAVGQPTTYEHHQDTGHFNEDERLSQRPTSEIDSAVEHAFDGHDDQDSIGRQVVGNESQITAEESELSRSNTDSTAGISPILSHVPADTGMSAMAHNQAYAEPAASPFFDQRSTPAADATSSRPTSSSTLRGASPVAARGHVRNTSSGTIASAHRRELALSSRSNSPARSPAFETEKQLPSASVGHMDHASYINQSGDAERGPVTESHENREFSYANREADMAAVVNAHSSEPEEQLPGIAIAHEQAQSHFIESRPESNAASSRMIAALSDTDNTPTRTASPGRGKVRVLAERYDEISARSPTESISSWASSSAGSASPQKRTGISSSISQGSAQVIGLDGKSDDEIHPRSSTSGYLAPAFTRPHLPGEWISYADSSRESEVPEDYDYGAGRPETPQRFPDETEAATPKADDGEVDFTPTTVRRNLSGRTHDEDDGPMAALAAAGSAMAASFLSSVGLGGEDSRSDSDTTESMMPSEDDMTPGVAEHNYDGFQREPQSDLPKTRPLQSDSASVLAPTTVHNKAPQELNSRFSADSAEPHTVEENATDHEEYPGHGIHPRAASDYAESSTESALNEETENDRLAKEIEGSFASTSGLQDVVSHGHASIPQATAPDTERFSMSRESTVLPREYDSYWAEKSPTSDNVRNSAIEEHTRSPTFQAQQVNESEAQIPHLRDVAHTALSQTGTTQSTSQPGFMTSRFSWERSAEVKPFSSSFAASAIPPAFTTTTSDRHAEPAGAITLDTSATTASRSEHEATSPVLPGPYIRPGAAQAMPTTNDEQNLQGRDLPHAVASYEDSEDARPNVPSKDTIPMPALSRDDSIDSYQEFLRDREERRPTELPDSDRHDDNPAQTGADEDHDYEVYEDAGRISEPHGSSTTADITRTEEQYLSAQDRNASAFASSDSQSYLAPKLTGFRDILALKHASERTDTFQKTQEEFASLPTGLHNWLGFMVTAHPELAHTDPTPVRSATTGLAGSVRHKLSPSVAKFGKSRNVSGSTSQTPYYQQYLDSAATGPGQSSTEASSVTPMSEDVRGRRPSVTMQSKGKDILHSAGIFGGKATTGAKGLFSRGKNRLKGNQSEKVD